MALMNESVRILDGIVYFSDLYKSTKKEWDDFEDGQVWFEDKIGFNRWIMNLTMFNGICCSQGFRRESNRSSSHYLVLWNSPWICWREICVGHVRIIVNCLMHASILIFRTEYRLLIYLQDSYIGNNVHPVYFLKDFLFSHTSVVIAVRCTRA